MWSPTPSGIIKRLEDLRELKLSLRFSRGLLENHKDLFFHLIKREVLEKKLGLFDMLLLMSHVERVVKSEEMVSLL